MFPQNRHNTANSASSSHHQSGTSGPGVAGTSNTSGMKLGATNSGTGAVKELLDKVYEEFGVLQQQLHNTRIELEKCQQEKDGLQRYSMMMNESLFSLNMETQKHIEIGKRLSGILTHVIPMLPQEHQGSAVSAIERAKAVGPQELLTNHLQQQQLAAMMSVAGPAAAAAAFNPAMMMAGMGLNLNVKQEDAMQQLFNNILKNPMLAGANNVAGGGGGPPQPPCIPQQIPSSNHPLMPGPSSSSSVPPTGGGDEGRPSTHPGRASSVLNSTGGGGSRPRSGTGTPVSYAKRTKLEPEDGDGELEIDVQNDDAGSSAALSHHTNGRTSQPFHKGKDERDTASASSRDSATPRSGKLQLASTPGSSSGCPPQPNIQQLLPPAMADLLNYGMNRFPVNFNNQISGLIGMTPGGGGQYPSSLNALAAAMTTNGKSPAYAFKVAHGEQIAPVSFPPDASLEPDVPKGLRRIGDLPHGDVVCAVTLAKDGRRVFTGGKGAVKVWDITERIFNSSTANASNDTSSGDDMGGVGSVETASNGGGGGRAASTEPWLPVATFPCLKDSYIRSCKLFSDGSTLIVGGETKTICILDVERGGEIKQTFDCEAEACYALAISQDCKTLFSCCSNGVVNVWDLTSGERIVQLIGHSDGASCVDISGDGQKLWTGGLDNTVRCWDIAGRRQFSCQEIESQVFSISCCPTDNWVAVGLEDNNVQLLNSTTMGEKYLLNDHKSCVLSMKFANSGKWFVSAGKDNVVNCWRTPYGYKLAKTKESSSVLSCDISKDDRFLLTGSGDKKASLYELNF